MAQFSKGISKGIFAAAALSLTFGAVAFARDLGQQPNGPLLAADASTAFVNRSTKTDRAARIAAPAIQTQTVSARLNDLSNTSVLIRVPLVRQTVGGTPAPIVNKSSATHLTVACEPTVSVLTEVAKQLQPGRCVT